MDHAASHMGETASSKKDNNVNKSIFEVFRNLTVDSEVKRNESCIALVQHLARATDEESNGVLSKDASYSLKRLVRGLGVKNQVAQKGYFTALVCVLESIPSISCKPYMGIVENEYCSEDATNEAEAYIGQVLAYGAAIRGGLLSRSSAEQQKNVISTLINCSKKKSYLPSASSSFIHDLILNSDKSVISEVIWPAVKEEVLKPLEDQTFDTFLLLILINGSAPTIFKNKKIQQRLRFQILSEESIQHIAEKLLGVSSSLLLKHPLYDEICRVLCQPENESLLKAFWATHVNNLLANPNKIKDHAVLHLLTILLNKIPNKRQVRLLVTPHVFDVIGRTLSGSRDKKYVEVFTKAQNAVTSLGNALSDDDVTDKIRMGVLNKMLFCSGNLQYEKKTGTHIAVVLENKLGKNSVQELTKQYRDVADGNSSLGGHVWTNPDRKFAAQQLTRLIGHQSCNEEIKWKVDQLLFLFHCGVLREDSSNPVSVELAGTMRQCFFRALDQTFSNFKTMIEVLSQVVEHVNTLLSNKKSIKALRVPFTDKAITAWQKMIKTVSLLNKKKESNRSSDSAVQIFHSLFLFMGLQLFADPDLSVGALEELHSCHERVKGGKRVSKNLEEPHWSEVTVEILLSLLSHDSHVLRTVVGKVFPHLSKHLTVSAFYQILEVLDPNQNENPLTSPKDLDNANESDVESSSDEMEVSEATEPRKANGKGKHAIVSKDSSEEGSDESENDDVEEEEEEDDEEDDDDDDYEDIDDDDMDETVNDKFREELRQALGNAASLTDTESVDMDDVDEEEGRRLDKALSDAFKTLYRSKTSKKNKKQLKKEEGITHFRNRVLDLVDLYISREPSLELCLACITPLLSLLAFCMKDVHQKPLEIRTKSVLVKVAALKKFSTVDGVDETSLADQIKSLALKGAQSTTTFLGLSELISDCCTFLVRCSEIVKAQSKPKASNKQNPVVQVYESLIHDFFTNRESLLPFSMFKSVISAQWNGCWLLAPPLVQNAFDSKMRPFRRGQAVDLLSIFFKNTRLLQSADDKQKQTLKTIVSSIVNHSMELLNISDSDSSARAQSQQNKRLTTVVLRLLQQILASPASKTVDVSLLSASLASYCQNCQWVPSETKRILSTLSKKLKFDFSTLKNLNRVENLQDMDADSSDEDEPTKSTSKKKTLSNNSNVNGFVDSNQKNTKQKTQNSKARNKKAKKLQRMAMMGEGLDSVTFSDVNDKVLNGMEPTDVEMEEDFSSNHDSHVNGILESKAMSSSKRQSEPSSTECSQGERKRKKKN